MKKFWKIAGVSFALLANTSLAWAQSATLLPNGLQYFMDANGKPLANGNVYFYVPGTTTPKTTWTSAGESVPQANPVPLGIAGRPANAIYGDGIYRQIVEDQFNNVIWDALTSSTGGGSGPSPGPTVGDGNIVGTILPWAGLVAPPNYVFAYGQAISRTTYPLYTSTVTITTNLICTNGLNVLSGIADTSQIRIGTPVEASCIPPGTTVTAVASTSVTVSANASISTAVSAQFFPYGNGDGATTLNVPDFRGRTLAGRDNMGISAAGILTQTYYGANTSPDALGSPGGAQSFAQTLAQLPTGITSANTGAISLSVTSTNNQVSQGGSIAASASGVNNVQINPMLAALTSTGNIAIGSVTVTSNNTSGAQISLIQPTITINYVIKVLPDTSSSVATGVASLGGMTGVIACGANVTCNSQTVSFVPSASTVSGPGTSVVGHLAKWSNTTGNQISDATNIGFPLTTTGGSTPQLQSVFFWPSIPANYLGTTTWAGINPDGTAINFSGTTTSGLQETIKAAVNYDTVHNPQQTIPRQLEVVCMSSGASNYITGNPITFPPTEDYKATIGSCGIGGSISGSSMTFDSSEILDYRHLGGEVWNVSVKPTLPTPGDRQIAIGPSWYEWSTHDGQFHIDLSSAGNTGIYSTSFKMNELNFGSGKTSGILADTVPAGANIVGNHIYAPFIHGSTSAGTGIQWGSARPPGGQLMRENIFDIGFSAGNGNMNGVDTWGDHDLWISHFDGITSGIPFKFESGACANIVLLLYSSNGSPTDSSGCTDNIVIGMGQISVGGTASVLTGTGLTTPQITATGSGAQFQSGLLAKSAVPSLALDATGGGADAKWWDFVAGTNSLNFRAVNDANSVANTWLTVARTGAAIGTVGFPAGPISLGASGTLGSAVFGNATSGTVTLQPVTGALGAVTALLPSASGTIAISASSPIVLNATTGNLTCPTCLAAANLTGATLASGVTASSLTSFGASPTISAPVINGTSTGTGVSSGNTANALVIRDGSGNFNAGTISAALTGHASLDLALTGGTMSGNIAMGGNQINNAIIGTSTPLAGTFTTLTGNNAFKLNQTSGHAIGAASPGLGWGLYHGGTISSTSGYAINWQTDASLTATANSDILQAMRITAAPVKGAFTGVTSYGLYVAGGSSTPYDWGIYVSDTSPSFFGGTLSTVGKLGYATGAGAGGAVTQITSRNTGVTLNTVTGAITLVSAPNAAVSGATANSVTVTNSSVAATDVVHVVQKSGTDLYEIFVTNVAAGSFKMTFFTTGGTSTEQPVFNFAVIKGSNN